MRGSRRKSRREPRSLLNPRLNGLSQIGDALGASLTCGTAGAGAAGRDGFLSALAQSALESVPAAADAHSIAADDDSVSSCRHGAIGYAGCGIQVGPAFATCGH